MDIIDILSLAIGLAGLLFGWFKDREVRKIRLRSNAPYFKFLTFSVVEKGPSGYDPQKASSDLDQKLIVIDQINPVMPKDYPDNLVLGVELVNTGTQMRVFSAKSKEPVLFKHYWDNDFSLRYIFRRAESGKKLFFTISYETVDGVLEKQEWMHIKGTNTIVRVRPKSV